jgi:hypothetical protein
MSGCKRTGPTNLKRHLTVQKWQIQPSTINRPLKEKLPTTTENSEMKLINKGEVAPIKREYLLR